MLSVVLKIYKNLEHKSYSTIEFNQRKMKNGKKSFGLISAQEIVQQHRLLF